MELDYQGIHSINFFKTVGTTTYKKNTWKDFHLIPVSRPKISYAEPNFRILKIPGMARRMDITDFHNGGLTFGERKGTWEFYVDHTFGQSWNSINNSISSFLDGKTIYVSLEDEPIKFYSGIVYMSDYKPGESFSRITLQYDLDYDSFIRVEGENGLLEYSPIKFIGENGFPYMHDYAIKSGASYVTEISGGSKVLLYDLTAMDVEES